jgi:hypothetical protein
MYINSIYIIHSVILLLLSVSSNFITETLGCKTQYILSKYMFAKHIILGLVVYFTLSFLGSKQIHPLFNILYTFLIWLLFIMFTKLDLVITCICYSLLIINYLIYTYIEYYKQYYNKYKLFVDKMEKLYNYINYLIVVLIIIGFIKYIYIHYNIIGKTNFSMYKFIFGINICNSLK